MAGSITSWFDTWEKERTLKEVPTRLLMDWRNHAYKCGGFYDPTESSGMGFKPIPVADILAELNTREHIPNNLEAKEIRKWKAQHQA